VSLSEQELRDHLADIADEASEPQFTLEHIAGTIRRRRRRIRLAASTGLACLVAVAVAVPLSLGTGEPPARRDAGGHGLMSVPPPPIREHFTATVNGQRSHLPGLGFDVKPGEKLTIGITVSVAKHDTITRIWLGISSDGYGFNRASGTVGNAGLTPSGFRSFLLQVRRPLRAGVHRYTIHWTVPALSGRTMPLAADWLFTSTRPPYEGAGSGPIAQFLLSS
jgi:hypothetical protein